MAATRAGTSQAQRVIGIGASAEGQCQSPSSAPVTLGPPATATCDLPHTDAIRPRSGALTPPGPPAASPLSGKAAGSGQLPPVVERDRVRPDSPRSDEPASEPELPCMPPDICSLPEEPCLVLSPERWLALRLIRSWLCTSFTPEQLSAISSARRLAWRLSTVPVRVTSPS